MDVGYAILLEGAGRLLTSCIIAWLITPLVVSLAGLMEVTSKMGRAKRTEKSSYEVHQPLNLPQIPTPKVPCSSIPTKKGPPVKNQDLPLWVPPWERPEP